MGALYLSRKLTFSGATTVGKLYTLELISLFEVRLFALADVADDLFGPFFKSAKTIGPVFGDLARA